MDKPELQHIINSLKTQLSENDGELGYWGEKITFNRGIPQENSSPPREGRGQGRGTVVEGGDKSADLERLRSHTIGDCRRCSLGDTRIKLVFGVGHLDAPVMFIGEGPGYEEDRQGEPFVGKAGQLLDRILASIGFDRQTVYIANIVKCHPMVDSSRRDQRGNDRPPNEEEMAACLPFLREQIRMISPKVIVTLGATATKALLHITDGITKLRGRWTTVSLSPDQEPIPVLPTYHPAALLRDESLKRLVWEDMKSLRQFLAH